MITGLSELEQDAVALIASSVETAVTGPLRLAYSGGLDSHVLLYLVAAHREQLPFTGIQAVHVNHGIAPDSSEWVHHCREVCGDLEVDIEIHMLKHDRTAKESLEMWARRGRYDVFTSVLRQDEIICLAHHMDDQAETLLLQLFRGAGAHGLAAMSTSRRLGRGILCRPLLNWRRLDVRNYAQHHGLNWIDDPSNESNQYDRNYLRKEILPRIENRWPGIAKTLRRSARHQSSLADLQNSQAKEDLARCQVENDPHELDIDALFSLGRVDQQSVLRAWFRELNLPLPALMHTEKILDEVAAVPPDRMPLVTWPGAEVRRYRDRLYAMAPQPSSMPSDSTLAFEPPKPVLGAWGTLSVASAVGQGLRQADCRATPLVVVSRRAMDRAQVKIAGDGHRYWKKMFQSLDVPPWEREHLPLLFVGEELVAIADRWIAPPWRASLDEVGWVLHWQRD